VDVRLTAQSARLVRSGLSTSVTSGGAAKFAPCPANVTFNVMFGVSVSATTLAGMMASMRTLFSLTFAG
jgi:hypothetical protein